MSTKTRFAHCIWCDKPVGKITFLRRIFSSNSQRQLLCDACRFRALRLFKGEWFSFHDFNPYDPPVVEFVPEVKIEGSGAVVLSMTAPQWVISRQDA